MRLLLDSHTLIWAVEQPTRLSAKAATAMRDPGNDLILRRLARITYRMSLRSGKPQVETVLSTPGWRDVKSQIGFLELPNHKES